MHFEHYFSWNLGIFSHCSRSGWMLKCILEFRIVLAFRTIFNGIQTHFQGIKCRIFKLTYLGYFIVQILRIFFIELRILKLKILYVKEHLPIIRLKFYTAFRGVQIYFQDRFKNTFREYFRVNLRNTFIWIKNIFFWNVRIFSW